VVTRERAHHRIIRREHRAAATFDASIGAEGHDQPIRRHTEVQRARRRAVHIRHVLDHLGAKPVQVEVCVLRHERVEAPEDLLRADRVHPLPLILLESSAQAQVASALPHAEHVRPVYDLAVAHAVHAEDEAEHLAVAVEGARGESADVLDDV